MQAARLILAAWLLAGCAAFRPRPADPGLFLLSPLSAGIELSVTQALTFVKGASRFESLAVVQLEKDSLSMAGLGPMGNRMLALRWDGKNLEEERDPSLPKELPARLILRDMQLAFWPAHAVREFLGRNWTLVDGDGTRVLSQNGKEVIRIRYAGPDHWHEGAIFEHLGLDYRLEVNPVHEDE